MALIWKKQSHMESRLVMLGCEKKKYCTGTGKLGLTVSRIYVFRHNEIHEKNWSLLGVLRGVISVDYLLRRKQFVQIQFLFNV